MRSILVAAVLGLAACGSGDGTAQEWTVPCEKGVASHDFGTTDPDVLVRVSAIGVADPTEIGTAADPSGYSTEDLGPINFKGSVAVVACMGRFNATSVIFAEEP